MNRILSHQIDKQDLSACVEAAKKRIDNDNHPEVSIAQQHHWLEQLTESELGKFLLLNKGLNGQWTDWVLTHPQERREQGLNPLGEPLTEIEHFFFDQAPVFLATQQRFQIFLQENQKRVFPGASLASIPCGLMGELFSLDFSGISEIKLVGIDLDPDSLHLAAQRAKQLRLQQFTNLLQKDAWQLNIQEKFDLISSNGLNIYEQDDNKVTDLYSQFYQALKPGGALVTSFITPPPSEEQDCCWELDKINKDHLLKQLVILKTIVGVGFHHFRKPSVTVNQLHIAGFDNVQFLYDDVKIFPTIVAQK